MVISECLLRLPLSFRQYIYKSWLENFKTICRFVDSLMGTNCAPFAVNLFLCHERDFMLSLSDMNQASVIEVF